MKSSIFIHLTILKMFIALDTVCIAATDLKLNNTLDYNSDSNDGPLVTGKEMTEGDISSKVPTYIIFYQRECYNSKRQARRTVDLYKKYRDRVKFIVIDLDSDMSAGQKELVNRFYRKYIPHVTVLGKKGDILYNSSGEVSTSKISEIIDNELM